MRIQERLVKGEPSGKSGKMRGRTLPSCRAPAPEVNAIFFIPFRVRRYRYIALGKFSLYEFT